MNTFIGGGGALFLWLILKYIESSDILHVTSSLNIHTILEQRP